MNNDAIGWYEALGNLQWLLIGMCCVAGSPQQWYFAAGSVAVGFLRMYIGYRAFR